MVTVESRQGQVMVELQVDAQQLQDLRALLARKGWPDVEQLTNADIVHRLFSAVADKLIKAPWPLVKNFIPDPD